MRIRGGVVDDGCPFCGVDPDRIVMQSGYGVALLDGFPVSPGHTLVIPRRHVPGLFHLSEEERADLWRLVARVRARLLDDGTPIGPHHIRPHGFTIGVNDGEAAGQTVEHAHIHVIPRYAGDVEDPRGGVRWVIPQRAAYWTPGGEADT